MTISLCMITRNEAENLDRCLQSVRGVVDETIVVDTGSEDGTVALAQAHGARVLHHPWNNDFSEARNIGLKQAGGEWILVLDADEELEIDSAQRLQKTVADHPEAEGFTLHLRNLLPAAELCSYQDRTITRLFRNRPHYRYEQIT